MVGSVHSQSADVRSNVAVRVPSLSHHSRGVPVISRRTILEINGRGQRMRIQYAIECRSRSSYIRSRMGRNDWRPGRGKGGKSPVAAIAGAVAIGGYDPEMVSGVRRQTADIRSDVLRRVPSLGLVGSCGPIARRSSILKTNSGG